MSAARVLVVDHHDSFVFNLVDGVARRGCTVRTVRSGLTRERLDEHLAEFAPHLVLLSPGPGHPNEARVTVGWLRDEPSIPVLGVCFGHQTIAVAAGGEVGRGPRPVHGRAVVVDFADDPLFEELPGSFPAARYHSLVVTRVPESLRVIASARDGDSELVMAVRHRRLPQIGLQFHPESFLTPWGDRLLVRTVRWAVAERERTMTDTEVRR